MTFSGGEALFASLFDDAALFPPGDAPMAEAVPAHRLHRTSWYAGFVGPFICADTRLAELPADLVISVVVTGGPGAVERIGPLPNAAALPHASSLCGACTEACPVKIPLHELLLELRRDLVEGGIASRRERLALGLWSRAWSSPAGYRLSTFAARLGQRIAGSIGPAKAWTQGRELPALARKRFRDWR